MRRQVYLLSILLWLLGSFFACAPSTDEVDMLLTRVEDCMEEHPDSALFFIQKIPHPEKLHGHLYYKVKHGAAAGGNGKKYLSTEKRG